MPRFTLKAPVKKSSDGSRPNVTVKVLEITRGTSLTGWEGGERPHNVVYLTAYTSEARAQDCRSSMTLALDYADARQLVRFLREELRLEREYQIRIAQQKDR